MKRLTVNQKPKTNQVHQIGIRDQLMDDINMSAVEHGQVDREAASSTLKSYSVECAIIPARERTPRGRSTKAEKMFTGNEAPGFKGDQIQLF
ncbi:MAG: hypothetical protein Q8R88_16350 [Desulfoprunum sp.]|nr:hypothetical protein [Desulfoprunum sp.]